MFYNSFVGNCFILFGMGKCETIIYFLWYNFPNCILHSLIIVAVDFRTQIKRIYEDKPSSNQYQNPHDPLSHLYSKRNTQKYVRNINFRFDPNR